MGSSRKGHSLHRTIESVDRVDDVSLLFVKVSSVITMYWNFLFNLLPSVVGEGPVDQGQNWAISPSLIGSRNQWAMVDPEHPAVSIVNELLELEWGEAFGVRFVPTKTNELIRNVARIVNVKGALVG